MNLHYVSSRLHNFECVRIVLVLSFTDIHLLFSAATTISFGPCTAMISLRSHQMRKTINSQAKENNEIKNYCLKFPPTKNTHTHAKRAFVRLNFKHSLLVSIQFGSYQLSQKGQRGNNFQSDEMQFKFNLNQTKSLEKLRKHSIRTRKKHIHIGRASNIHRIK